MPPSRPRSYSPRAERTEQPPRRTRSRSRSPRRDRDTRERRPVRNDRGFRWKERRNGDDADRRSGGRLERGYRDRDADERRERRDPHRDAPKDYRGAVDVAGKFGPSAATSHSKPSSTPAHIGAGNGAAPPPAAAAAATHGEPMIVVHVNDRLGTKAAIPCLASDPIRMFKAMVAARIGREPHEILLKRQGERPFKDQLTLEDYGVSNGVQLDLEVDTGD